MADLDFSSFVQNEILPAARLRLRTGSNGLVEARQGVHVADLIMFWVATSHVSDLDSISVPCPKLEGRR